MKVAVIQLGINDEESKSQRILRVRNMLGQIREADLIMLPELWNTGYFSFGRYREESETLAGETTAMLAEMAAGLRSYIFGGSFVERAEDRLYNTCLLIGPDGEIKGRYRKIHLFGYGSAEKEVISAGGEIAVVDTDYGKMGLSICYDIRFPELYRKMVDMGAVILLNCAGWPYPRVEHWLLLNRVRALENQCYFLSCGCAGASRGKAFIGRSQVVDPWGTVAASADERETVLQTVIHPEAVPEVRKEFTALQDRVFLT